MLVAIVIFGFPILFIIAGIIIAARNSTDLSAWLYAPIDRYYSKRDYLRALEMEVVF